MFSDEERLIIDTTSPRKPRADVDTDDDDDAEMRTDVTETATKKRRLILSDDDDDDNSGVAADVAPPRDGDVTTASRPIRRQRFTFDSDSD